MPKKKWIVATAALAVVKGKKLASTKKDRPKKGEKQSSSFSFVSSDESSYNGSGKTLSGSLGGDSDSDFSSDEVRATARSGSGEWDQSDGSEASDSSSSYGCGTYHRRESLSLSSAVTRNSDETSSCLQSASESLSPESDGTHFSGLSMDEEHSKPCDTLAHIENRSQSSVEMGASFRPLLKSLGFKSSMKNVNKVGDVDGRSESSPKLSPNSLNPSVYDDDQMFMVHRRRSLSRGGRGRDRQVGCQPPGESMREVRVGSTVDPLVNMAVEGRSMSAPPVKSRKTNQNFAEEENLLSGVTKQDDAEDKFNALLLKVRRQSPLDNREEKATRLKHLEPKAGFDESGEFKMMDPDISTVRGACDIGGELSYSLKKELLANANSNLRSSETSVASVDSAYSLNDDVSKKSAGSSRFASMMASLKSSSESTMKAGSKHNQTLSDCGSESDDELVFEAPKIVNERGQSVRRNEEYANVAPPDDTFQSTNGGTGYDDDDSRVSRFHVRGPSIRQLLHYDNEGPSRVATASIEHNSDDVPHVAPIEQDYHLEKVNDSKPSDDSISTASSGEDETSTSATNLARIKYPEDEESQYDEELDYYVEPSMTVLTPITEMGSMESDAESVSGGSNLDDDTEITPFPPRADPLTSSLVNVSALLLSKNSMPDEHGHFTSCLSFVVKYLKSNYPDLRQVKVDDSRLNDLDAAKLLFLLRENCQVTELSLSENELGDGSAISLARVLSQSESLSMVTLRSNNIGNMGALALHAALNENQTMIQLDLADNSIDPYVVLGLHISSSAFYPLDICSSNHCEETPIPCKHHAPLFLDAEHSEHTCLLVRGHYSSSSQSWCGGHFRIKASQFSSTEYGCIADSHKTHSLLFGKCDEYTWRIDSCGSVEAAVVKVSAATVPSQNASFSTDHMGLLPVLSFGCKYADSARILTANNTKTNCSLMSSQSDTKTGGEMAVLLAISLAHTSLDSSWLTKTPRCSANRSSQITQNGLGLREKLLSQEVQVRSETVSLPLCSLMGLKWRSPMWKGLSLRHSLLCLSWQHEGEPIDTNMAFTGSSCTHQLSLSTIENSKLQQWANSLKKLDPRWQIRKFFNDLVLSDHMSNGAAIFSVWRPTSADAIAKMMSGEGVGKGLEIKGKSAKKGDLSGFIPFLQIHNDEHKNQIRTIPKGDRTKIFFRRNICRDKVGHYLQKISKELTLRVAQAKIALVRAKFGCDPSVILREELNYAATMLSCEVDNPSVILTDDYAPEMFCLEVSCRVLWKGLVETTDISRKTGSTYDTGRASQPAFQDMNFSSLRRRHSGEPLPVLIQKSINNPFDPRMLVMGYEEEGKVVPVVSDFDCFLIGSKHFSYEDPMLLEQVELMHWCVSQIEWILANHLSPESWTTRWLEVLKHAAKNGFCPAMPRFGFGDPTSYSMIEASVQRLARTCGAVRHGPECFNFFFPQELDDEFLIIFPGCQIWQYVSEKELLSILRRKIEEGFTFPLNPKWLLCDPGWMTLFQDLLGSHFSGVIDSLNRWFPPKSGLRERILDIHLQYPCGFHNDDQVRLSPALAEKEYERYLILQRARKKLHGFLHWRNMLKSETPSAIPSVDYEKGPSPHASGMKNEVKKELLSLNCEEENM